MIDENLLPSFNNVGKMGLTSVGIEGGVHAHIRGPVAQTQQLLKNRVAVYQSNGSLIDIAGVCSHYCLEP